MSRHILFFYLIYLIPFESFSQMLVDSTKKNIAAIPIVNYDPVFGVNIGFLGQLFYKVNSKDTVSPSSSTSIIGLYTSNKTWFGAGFRYMMIAKERIKIGVDAAVGKEDWGLYFRIGEAFGR